MIGAFIEWEVKNPQRRRKDKQPARRRIDPQETLARLKANKPDRLPRLER